MTAPVKASKLEPWQGQPSCPLAATNCTGHRLWVQTPESATYRPGAGLATQTGVRVRFPSTTAPRVGTDDAPMVHVVAAACRRALPPQAATTAPMAESAAPPAPRVRIQRRGGRESTEAEATVWPVMRIFATTSRALVSVGVCAGLVLSACGSSGGSTAASTTTTSGAASSGTASSSTVPGQASAAQLHALDANPLPGMPPITNPSDIYAADTPNNLMPAARSAIPMVYVPDTISGDVYEINPATYQVVRHFAVGSVPQHVVPSYDGRTLWVTVNSSNKLVPIDPTTGQPGTPVPVEDPYNLYFTPDGAHAIVVAEALQKLDFRDPNTMALQNSLYLPDCAGVDHIDFTANGRYLLATCEFTFQQNQPGRLVVVDVAAEKEIGEINLGPNSQPQDVKLSPDGTVFYVADLRTNGVWIVDAYTFKNIGFILTGSGTHGLYVSRDNKDLYIANRGSGTISVLDFATRKVVDTWTIPGGGSPDMGNVSADGKVLWLSGRYDNVVYAFDTTTGHLINKIPVGAGPHGVCVWPQPGRYSLGHTGIMR